MGLLNAFGSAYENLKFFIIPDEYVIVNAKRPNKYRKQLWISKFETSDYTDAWQAAIVD